MMESIIPVIHIQGWLLTMPSRETHLEDLTMTCGKIQSDHIRSNPFHSAI